MPPDSDPADPFRPPTSAIGPADGATMAEADAITLRQRYVRRERSIRSLGLVIDLVAVLILVFCLGSVPRTIGLMTGSVHFKDPATAHLVMVRGIGFATTGSVLGLGLIFLGTSLRSLRTWARWVTSGLAALLLLLVIVTLAQLALKGLRYVLSIEQLSFSGPPALLLAAILFLLVARPAGVVFSEPYRAAVRATPQLTPRPGWGARVLLGLMILLAILMAFAGITHTATIGG